MKPLSIILLALSFFLFSCGHSSKDGSMNQTKTELHQSHHESAGLQLNNGEKWRVNEEMKPYVTESEKLLKHYNSEEYRELAAKLKEKNSNLIKSCTMKGESHDELHKWLHPHIELIDKLEKSGSPGEAHEIILELKASFETYNQYFQ